MAAGVVVVAVKLFHAGGSASCGMQFVVLLMIVGGPGTLS